MSRTALTTRTGWFAAGRLVWGSALLLAPHRVFRVASRWEGSGGAVAVARVLGLREVCQATISIAAPRPPVLTAGATVDGIHALSMVVFAAGSKRYRRPALVSAALAMTAGLTGLMLSRRS